MIKTVYQTAYELETDKVLEIMARPRPHRQAKACKRQASTILAVVSTVLATLTVIAACSGDWRSAFAGSVLLLTMILTGRVVR